MLPSQAHEFTDIIISHAGWRVANKAVQLSKTTKTLLTPFLILDMYIKEWRNSYYRLRCLYPGGCIEMYEAKDPRWTIRHMLEQRHTSEQEGSRILAGASYDLEKKPFDRMRWRIGKIMARNRKIDEEKYGDGWDAFFMFDNNELGPLDWADERQRPLISEDLTEENQDWIHAVEYQEFVNKLSLFPDQCRHTKGPSW